MDAEALGRDAEDRIMKITLYGDPRAKKNNQRIVMCGGYPRLLPSKAYKAYEAECLRQIGLPFEQPEICEPINLSCQYFMQTRRRVDLVNLLEATCDILVAAGVLADDNHTIIRSFDGCGVHHDKENPRVEIEITRAGGDEHGDRQERDPERA